MLTETDIQQALHARRVVPLAVPNPHGPLGLEQVAAASAEYVRREEVPAERIARERDVLAGQAEHQGKPTAILEKIVEGRLNKFFAEVCLLEQPFIRDDKRTVAQIVEEAAHKTGENIVVRRFTRFRLGQE